MLRTYNQNSLYRSMMRRLWMQKSWKRVPRSWSLLMFLIQNKGGWNKKTRKQEDLAKIIHGMEPMSLFVIIYKAWHLIQNNKLLWVEMVKPWSKSRIDLRRKGLDIRPTLKLLMIPDTTTFLLIIKLKILCITQTVC